VESGAAGEGRDAAHVNAASRAVESAHRLPVPRLCLRRLPGRDDAFQQALRDLGYVEGRTGRHMHFSKSGTLMRNMVSARRVSSGHSTVFSIVIAGILVFGAFALLKVNSGAKQAPTEELLTGSIARSPAVRKSPSNDSMAAFLSAR
jgi:hypothetical protein